MSQLDETREIIAEAETAGPLLAHQCELLAMLLDKLEEGKFNLAVSRRKKTPGRAPICIDTYLKECKANEVKAIPAEDKVFEYAREKGIPLEFVHLCFTEFVARNRDNNKRYKNWPQAFRNCVRDNWYKLWWCTPEETYELTSAGKQASKKE